MAPTRNNRGVAHENGAIESPHGHLKQRCRGRAAAARLARLRRPRRLSPLRRRARRPHATPATRKRIDAERAALQPLPTARTDDYEEAIVTVTSSGGFMLRKVFYTVPSRLIGHRLRVRLYDDRLECFLGATRADDPAARPRPCRAASTAMSSTTATSSMPCGASRWRCSTSSTATSSSRATPIRAPSRRCWRRLPRTRGLPHHGRAAGAGPRAGLRGRTRRRARRRARRRRLPDLAALRARFAPDPAALPDVTVALTPLIAYDELAPSRRSGGAGMKRPIPSTPPASTLLLTELRLPAIKQIWPRFAEQRRQGGLAGRPLPRRAGRARDRRARPAPHRAPSRRSPAAARQDPRHLRLRRRADGLQGPGHGARRRRQLAREGRQPAPVRPARRRKSPSGGRPRPRP